MKAGGESSIDIRRVHDDERKQARNRQANHQFEETAEQERTEVDRAKNKKTVSGIPDNLVLAHACP
jgi:hypothetical protein